MKLTVIGKQISVYDDTKELIAEKLQKLDRYFGAEGGNSLRTYTCYAFNKADGGTKAYR